jgi:hypothetical protein
MGQIPVEPLKPLLVRDGSLKAHNKHEVLPSYEGRDSGLLAERQQEVHAGGQETIIGWGNEKPQR